MRFLLALLLLFSTTAFGQCKDSLNADTYFQCQDPEYAPVCGCDYVTYRNACAAEHWGGLINDGFYKGWTDDAICGNFHIDFNPTAVDRFPAKFQAFINNPSNQSIPVSIYIYDVFGRLEFEYFDTATRHGLYPEFEPLEINAQLLAFGVHNLVVIIEGEKQFIKFVKVSE